MLTLYFDRVNESVADESMPPPPDQLRYHMLKVAPPTCCSFSSSCNVFTSTCILAGSDMGSDEVMELIDDIVNDSQSFFPQAFFYYAVQ